MSTESAGALVHFRKTIYTASIPSQPVSIQITPDTKYKFYINSELVALGPVKGDHMKLIFDSM